MTEEKDCECRKVSSKQMEQDLYGGGWTSSHGKTIWTTLWGDMYRGPFKAWHVWAGIPMCDYGKVKV